jgi:hypothetical protein
MNFMAQNTLIKEVLETIAQGNLDGALASLERQNHRFKNEHDRNTLLGMKSEYQQIRNKHIQGVLTDAEHLRLSNDFRQRLLDLISSLASDPDDPPLQQAHRVPKTPTMKDVVWENYFPSTSAPFSEMLDDLFFSNTRDPRYPIHGPNVVRFAKALFNYSPEQLGLFKTEDAARTYHGYHTDVLRGLLEVDKKDPLPLKSEEYAAIEDLLILAAIYHDIGKFIKLAKHPDIGANLVRYYDDEQKQHLMEFLSHSSDKEAEREEKRQNRFAQLASIIQHHDKFGVVSTGEASYPIFSDILYFNSDESKLLSIKKNVTAVMLLNLADIAAVNKASGSDRSDILDLVKKIALHRKGKELEDVSKKLEGIVQLISKKESCLGLSERKTRNVLKDWKALIEDIEAAKGDRTVLRERLIKKAQNPAATIERIHRLIIESVEVGTDDEFDDAWLISTSAIEMILLSRLGTYKFQNFCETFATVIKLDYGLRFFMSIFCACTRKAIFPDPKDYMEAHKKAFSYISPEEKEKGLVAAEKLTPDERAKWQALEAKGQSAIVDRVAHLVVRVLEDMVSRYAGVFNVGAQPARRFGLEMGDLSQEKNVWESIISQLCLEEGKETFALSWMIDEVTIWSFD